MNGELKVYSNKWKLFAYMFPFLFTLSLVIGTFFVDPDLLFAPQDWAYKISGHPVTAKVEIASPEFDIQLTEVEKKEVAGFASIMLIFMFLLSILLEVFIALIAIVIFFKSIVRFFRGDPEIIISSEGVAHYSKGFFSWDKIGKVYLYSNFNYMFCLGPWWFAKRFYSLKLVSKKDAKEVRITLKNIDTSINSVYSSIKSHKDINFNF